VILDVRSGSLSDRRHEVIEGQHIQDIHDGPAKVPSQARRIDLSGRTLMPGLCDAHVHCMVPINSFANFSKWSPTYAAYRAMDVLRGMLRRGFTTVRDAGGADFGVARAIQEGIIDGPRLLYSGKALSQTGGHGDMRGPGEQAYDDHYYVPSLGRVCDGVDAVRRAARDELRRGAHQIKLMVGGGIASYTDPIHYNQFSGEEIRAAVEEARNAGTYVMAHAYCAHTIEHAARNGVHSIEHGNFLDDERAAIMIECGAVLVPTLVAYTSMWNEGLEAGMPAELHAKIKPVLDVGPASLEVAHRAGVEMVYGTDLIGSLHRHQNVEFRIRGEVLGAAEVIRHATLNAARLFRMEGEIGEVIEGARADLIAVDGNPLEDLNLLVDTTRSLSLIVTDGRIVHGGAST
jgi:imidazolonepropionase-like amidohydrolase